MHITSGCELVYRLFDRFNVAAMIGPTVSQEVGVMISWANETRRWLRS